ncbi:MAG: NAD(+)/NADH kinase [Bacillota bacterium]
MKIITDRIGLVLNTDKRKSFELAERVMGWLSNNSVEYLLEESAAAALKQDIPGATYDEMRQEVDLVILFGGDGTFLHTARYFTGSKIPLLGINLGHLGFLTEIETGKLEETLEYLIKGKYQVEKRMVLKARVKRGPKSGADSMVENLAINDVVVNRGASAHMIRIELYINGEIVNSYRADGIIVSTPTGSTAYSLSAGGPIINPRVRAILITPICPHTLHIRPMVISERERLKVVVSGEKDDKMKLTADGNFDYDLHNGDSIRIGAAGESIHLVKFPDRTFYSILHEKMSGGLY